ncbi:hypothetical protein BKA70DRAFT_1233149 [Coprinopsis sp. MPI-PUGE-AT-0042]|nr:hypothetical protein BKA70DRAFT_1233149 [Coprinopsis sp. MPI-PUGE-AT-0042]
MSDNNNSPARMSANPKRLLRSSTRGGSFQLQEPPLPARIRRHLPIPLKVNESHAQLNDRDSVTVNTQEQVGGSNAVMEPLSYGMAQRGTPVEEALRRVRRALEAKKSVLRETREELRIAKEELQEARGEAQELNERLESASASQEQYRNWWINEVQFTKLILTKVPRPNQDWDLVLLPVAILPVAISPITIPPVA